jgi:membrane-bound lytic murein transglycosylase D
MISWWTGILLLCALLAGCGGGKKAAVAPPPAPPPDFAQEDFKLEEQEESLAEQLSENRVEELYAKSGLRGEDPVLEEELKKWDQALKIDVPVAKNKRVRAYLVYFTTERKRTIRKYLARSTRYLPMIREIFQEHGLPEDLAYLAMIESGFKPHAYSHAHACGMWQFIQGTGRRYGLAINNYVDERRDPVKATHAAANYLLDLYKQFGSWYLAAASYNCGENRVQREIDSSNHRNFWELSANQCLPSETKNYVPQMIAATIIAKNPEKFGFKNIPYLPPLEYDTVKVNQPTSLEAAAIACKVPLEEIALLNPELRKKVTPPEQEYYLLKIPKFAEKRFTKNIQLARIEAPARASAPVRTAKRSYRRSYSKKKARSRKVAKSTRYKRKASRRRASYSKKRSYRTAQARKGKSRSSQTVRKKRDSIKVASVLAGGKSSRVSKSSSKSKTKRGSYSKSSRNSKSRVSKRTKKKATSRKSSRRLAAAKGKKGKKRTAKSRSRKGKGSKVAKSSKKSKSRKSKAVRTAARRRPGSS